MKKYTRNNLAKLEEEQPFSFQETKGGLVFIYWGGKQVMVLKGKEAIRFQARIESLSEVEAQLVMAKLTGNFKRGNEKQKEH